MGLFSWNQSEESRRADEVRSGKVAPDRSERQKCWEARDIYYQCLDKNNIMDALKDDKRARKLCPEQNAGFERDCAAAWVKYFKQWRVADLQKKARIAALEKEGAVKMDVTSSFTEQAKGTTKDDIQDLLSSRKK